MNDWAVASITFVCVFGGALAGMWLRSLASERHLSEAAKDIVKLVTGLIATLSALVLGLLIASAKSSFDSFNDEFKESAAKVILLDRALGRYGPDANDVREALRKSYAARLDRLFPQDGRPIVERMTALFIGALSVATAVFLIEEMNDPLAGIIAISSVPMRNALAILGK